MSFLNQTKTIINQHGIRGLYKGLTVSAVGAIPFVAIKMSLFDFLLTKKRPLLHLMGITGQEESQFVNMQYVAFAGSFAGFSAVVFVYPFDLVRRFQQLNGSSSQHKYSNLMDLMKQIY